MGLFFSELQFCFYWFVTTVVRWNPIYRNTFKDRLSHRQWQSQEFRSGGARLKDKIGSKKLININNKINKQLYDNVIVIQNLT